MASKLQLKEFIILSAELTTSNHNDARTARLENMLVDLKLSYKRVEGVYKGTSEVSFMVIVKDEAEIQTITDLGLITFAQESVLFRDLHGNAKLVYKDGEENIGTFKQVDDVINLDAYTIVNNNYWVAV
jgi:hypothetical protein